MLLLLLLLLLLPAARLGSARPGRDAMAQVLLTSRQVVQMVGKVPEDLKELHQWFRDVAATCQWGGEGARGAAAVAGAGAG